MPSLYPKPAVAGVRQADDGSGLELPLDPDINPLVTVTYPPIDKPHTVSVSWEVYGSEDGAPPFDDYVYCTVIKKQPAHASTFETLIWEEYTYYKSAEQLVRVRYSISIENAPAESSEPLEFTARRDWGPGLGWGRPDIAFREAVAQWPDSNEHSIVYADIITDNFGDYATLYAFWPAKEAKHYVTWEKQGSSKKSPPLWKSAPQTAIDKKKPVTFLIPKTELLKLDKGIGILKLNAVKGSETPTQLWVSVNYFQSRQEEGCCSILNMLKLRS